VGAERVRNGTQFSITTKSICFLEMHSSRAYSIEHLKALLNSVKSQTQRSQNIPCQHQEKTEALWPTGHCLVGDTYQWILSCVSESVGDCIARDARTLPGTNNKWNRIRRMSIVTMRWYQAVYLRTSDKESRQFLLNCLCKYKYQRRFYKFVIQKR
jgi:hypothetical protein